MADSILDLDLDLAPREEEALFARGDDDLLVRQEKATRDQFGETVTITVDGRAVTVPKATPLTDALGNPRRGPDGQLIPRATTIYDAASQFVRERKWTPSELGERIPVLCHQEHLNPVAVCRMCSVHISSMRRGKLTPGRKLVPACQHRVEENMVVTTRKGGGDFGTLVDISTRMLAELLTADHLPPVPPRPHSKPMTRSGELKLFDNELAKVAGTVGAFKSRFGREQSSRNFHLHPKSRPFADPALSFADAGPAVPGRHSLPMTDLLQPDLPYSSRSIQVDHDKCILCDRCVRSCDDVKPFKVIGHTGKGFLTRISFDLDQVMNQSSCVQCGECMTSCPTGALTLKRRVVPKPVWAALGITSPEDPRLHELADPTNDLPEEFLLADRMMDIEVPYLDDAGVTRQFQPFHGIPYPYLRWNEGAVRERHVHAGEVLCTQGEYGTTAFLLIAGEFDVFVSPPAADGTGLLGRLLGKSKARRTEVKVYTAAAGRDLILGEMACLTNTARTATIKGAGDGTVLEVTRNMLAMLQRNRAARDVLDRVYRARAISNCLQKGKLFATLTGEQRATLTSELQKVATLAIVEPGEMVVRQGDPIGLDESRQFRGDFYILRIGSAKVSRTEGGREQVLARLKPDDSFGEIALLSDHPRVAPLVSDENKRRRTASVTALDDVEVVRIPGEAFRRLLEKNPKIEEELVARAVESLGPKKAPPKMETDLLGTYLREGLFQGQKMLVLDLESCTRCDECTKACADAHGDGISRLLREGPRFDRFLVATSCRSCHTPYCMDGCPVDAIHRGARSLEVRIDAHCIGCGLCANNCPYESIQMVPVDEAADPEKVRRIAAVELKAVNCDLCQDLVPEGAETFCVSACPHEAAFRWDGEKLLKKAGG